jgi:hypothetical protein
VISALASQVLYHLCAHTFTHFEHFLKLLAQSQMSIMRGEGFFKPKGSLAAKNSNQDPKQCWFFAQEIAN